MENNKKGVLISDEMDYNNNNNTQNYTDKANSTADNGETRENPAFVTPIRRGDELTLEETQQIISIVKDSFADEGLEGQIKSMINNGGDVGIIEFKEYEIRDDEAWEISEKERKEKETFETVFDTIISAVSGGSAKVAKKAFGVAVSLIAAFAPYINNAKDWNKKSPRAIGGRYYEGKMVVSSKDIYEGVQEVQLEFA